MIFEKTRLALEKLLPQADPADAVPENAGDVDDIEGTAPEEPRKNGIMACDYKVHGYHLDAQVAPDQLLDAVAILDTFEFFLESITGVDWIKDDQFEVVYDFSRYDFDCCRVVIRTRVARSQPSVPTISYLYSGANWHERETHEFFGINFEGHPNLVPLLLPEDADFHPLLKDFKA